VLSLYRREPSSGSGSAKVKRPPIEAAYDAKAAKANAAISERWCSETICAKPPRTDGTIRPPRRLS
jgi:hypothetical protein